MWYLDFNQTNSPVIYKSVNIIKRVSNKVLQIRCVLASMHVYVVIATKKILSELLFAVQ